MTPEQEERLGKAMAELAVAENKRMKDRLGGPISYAGLQGRVARQQMGATGGRPKKQDPRPKNQGSRLPNIERVRALEEIKELQKRLKKLESLL